MADSEHKDLIGVVREIEDLSTMLLCRGISQHSYIVHTD